MQTSELSRIGKYKYITNIHLLFQSKTEHFDLLFLTVHHHIQGKITAIDVNLNMLVTFKITPIYLANYSELSKKGIYKCITYIHFHFHFPVLSLELRS